MTLKDQLLENTDAFIGKINEIPNVHFNTRPNVESWSVAEVLEHVYRSEFDIPRLFTGETKTLTNRAPDTYLGVMKKQFLGSYKKMKATKVTLPTEGDKTKTELVEKFRENRNKIAKLAQQKPLEELCLKYEHPMYGYLTRLEWIHFNIIHTQRHMRQVERIQSQLQ